MKNSNYDSTSECCKIFLSPIVVCYPICWFYLLMVLKEPLVGHFLPLAQNRIFVSTSVCFSNFICPLVFCFLWCCLRLNLVPKRKMGSISACTFVYLTSHWPFYYSRVFCIPLMQNGNLESSYAHFSKFYLSGLFLRVLVLSNRVLKENVGITYACTFIYFPVQSLFLLSRGFGMSTHGVKCWFGNRLCLRFRTLSVLEYFFNNVSPA